MKKILLSLAFLALCVSPLNFPSSACAGESEQIAAFDGNAWLTMDNDNKQSFLFGLQNAIAMEYALNMEKIRKEGKAPTLENIDLSPFEKGWAVAFSDTTRQHISEGIDNFYTSHPDQKERHVLDVIWKELIMPAQQAKH